MVDNFVEMLEFGVIESVEELYVKVIVMVLNDYVGVVMELV